MRRPFFKSKQAAAAVGVAGLAVAWFALYDAYERRGGATPRWLRPLTWW